MEIKRDALLGRLRQREGNGLIKIITGMRRSGKSYLLFRLFVNDLRRRGVRDDHIITAELDNIGNEHLREPHALYDFIKSRIIDGERHYILLDEIQFAERFEDVLNGFLHIGNADVYVTGSNSKFLSSDIVTEFRGRGSQIRVRPLSFADFSTAYDSVSKAWSDYLLYGGLPGILSMEGDSQKSEYLNALFYETYLRDIVERNGFRGADDLDELVSFLASAVGSLTNPSKLARTFKSVKGSSITDKTIKVYLDALKDAFLIEGAVRYDIRGKKYISTPQKYYFTDVGIRNAVLGFRQIEDTHLMENVIFNELRDRGYDVDVGAVESKQTAEDGGRRKTMFEVDFIARRGREQYYVQSAYAMPDEQKREAEERPLRMIDDSFKKIIIDGSSGIELRRNEHGITIMNLPRFLLDRDSLDA